VVDGASWRFEVGGSVQMNALVIGGTGPTGPDVVAALLDRSFTVAVLHRGLHEPDEEVLGRVEHIHADPHFTDTLAGALEDRVFDLIVATYGRMHINAEVCAGRCAQFIGIGGNPAYPGMLDRRSAWPEGMRILARESDPVATAAVTSRDRFAARVVAGERAVLDGHSSGAFSATYLRYPIIYGRRTWAFFERGIVRRLVDGRRRLLLPDGGLSIFTRCADRNAANFVAGVVDHPDPAAGQVYNCADDGQFSLYQWTQMICAALGADAEIVSAPLPWTRPIWNLFPTGPLGSPHTLVDTTKARQDLGYANVISPTDALGDLVRHLARDTAGLAAVRVDTAAEDAIMDACEETGRRLALSLGWDGVEEAFDHPYDHPRLPE
jgi:nucleoside-diphosphate-sugar epimerase